MSPARTAAAIAACAAAPGRPADLGDRPCGDALGARPSEV